MRARYLRIATYTPLLYRLALLCNSLVTCCNRRSSHFSNSHRVCNTFYYNG